MSTSLRALAGALKTAIDAAQRALGYANQADQAAKSASSSLQGVTTQVNSALVLAGNTSTNAQTATAAANTATGAANTATTKANEAATSATAAQTAKGLAEAARDAANTSARAYTAAQGTAAALADAALATGQSFSVLAADNKSYTVYRKDAGPVATPLYSQYVRAYLDGVLPAVLGAETGYSYAILDTNGAAAFLIGTDGTVYPSKLSLPAASVAKSALAADVVSALPGVGVGAMLQPLTPETGYSYAVVDSAGRASLLIGTDGTVYPQKLALPAASVGLSALDAVAASSLTSPGVGPMLQLMAPESGYVYAVTDANMRVLFGIPTSGSVVEMTAARAVTAFNSTTQANASYVTYGYTDGAGKRQIRVVRRSDGKVFNVTSVGNNYDGLLTADNVLLFTSDASGSPVRRWLPAEGGTDRAMFPRKAVYTWGDSTSQNTYQTALASTLALSVYMGGIASQTSGEIMARQGGKPALVTVTGDLIPASGPVSLTAWSEDFLASKNTPADTRSMAGTLAGVPGTLTKSGSPSAYSFARTTAGVATACPPNTPFIPDDGEAGRDAIAIIWAGTNDVIYGGSAAGAQTNVNAGVAYLSAYVKNVLVVAPLNRTSQPVGGAQYQMILDMEASLSANASAVGYAYFNLRTHMITNRAAIATALGLTLTAQDETDAANGYIPSSFRADTVHLTPTVNAYLGSTVFPSVFAGLGWLGA